MRSPFKRREHQPKPAKVDPADLGLEGRRGVVIVVLSAGWSPELGEWSQAVDSGYAPDGSQVPAAHVTLTAERAARYRLSGSPHVLAVEAETGHVHASYAGRWSTRAWDHLLELAASGRRVD